MSNEIMLRDSDILNPEYSFDDKIIVAEHIATSLAKVIKDQKLAVNIQGNNYVTVEGWNTLGTMMGCSAIIEDVTDVTELLKTNEKERIFKANVSIRKGETVLSRASAIASTKKVGKYKTIYTEPFVAYSMAQTRAMGKAYRMAFSWIMKMSGYEPTPEEEMPDDLKKQSGRVKPTTPKPPKKEELVKEESVDEGVIEAEIVEKEEKNYDELIKPFITKVQESGVNVRKPAIMKQIRDSDLDIETQEELIDYVRENLRNSDLKAKYDN